MFDTTKDPKENLFALFLDSRNGVIGVEHIARGATNACALSPREILSAALVAGAVRLLLCHNHPSGDPAPSAEDIDFTRRFDQACRTIGLELVDHITLGACDYDGLKVVSLKERGFL
jgi:DNA repair protein RadC